MSSLMAFPFVCVGAYQPDNFNQPSGGACGCSGVVWHVIGLWLVWREQGKVLTINWAGTTLHICVCNNGSNSWLSTLPGWFDAVVFLPKLSCWFHPTRNCWFVCNIGHKLLALLRSVLNDTSNVKGLLTLDHHWPSNQINHTSLSNNIECKTGMQCRQSISQPMVFYLLKQYTGWLLGKERSCGWCGEFVHSIVTT